MTILAWVIGILIVGFVYGLMAVCRASSMQSRAEEWEAALRRAQEAEAAGKKELDKEKDEILEELTKPRGPA
jgi:uncharacterized membrane protein